MRHSVIEKQRRTGRPFSDVQDLPETNDFNPIREVACSVVKVPYGKVAMGGNPIHVRREGRMVTVGQAIPNLTTFEMLPEGRQDALLPKGPDALDRFQHHLERIQTDGEYAMRVALEKWADDVHDGLLRPNGG